MVSPLLIAFEQVTVGRACNVRRRKHEWVFAFGDSSADGCRVVTQTLWRVVEGDRIAVTSEDDRQQFGLTTPVDAEEKCNSLFRGRLARSVLVRAVTADVAVQFDDDTRLEVISSSAGYESWQAYFRHAEEEITLIGGGGGSLSYTSAPVGSSPRVRIGRPLP